MGMKRMKGMKGMNEVQSPFPAMVQIAANDETPLFHSFH
jgi:hypothetical protein